MSFTKQAHEAAQAKVAAADHLEQQHAIDVGFALGCQKLGLDQVQTQKLAKVAMARIDEASKKIAADSAAAVTTPTGKEPQAPAPGAVPPKAPAKAGTVHGKKK